jgi:hypothetical protein
MADPVGTVFAGVFYGFAIQGAAAEGSALPIPPDRDNDALQPERQTSVYCCIPEWVWLTCNPANNTGKVWRLHFVGRFNEATAGLDEDEPVGSVLPFAATARLLARILKQAKGQTFERCNRRDHKYRGVATCLALQFRIASTTVKQTAMCSFALDAFVATPSSGRGESTNPEGFRSCASVRLMSRSAWAPEPQGRDCWGSQICEWAWRRQGCQRHHWRREWPHPSEIFREGFYGNYGPQFRQPLWGSEEEGVYG